MNDTPPVPAIGWRVEVLRADGTIRAGEVVDIGENCVCVRYLGIVGHEHGEPRERPLTHWFLRSAARASGEGGQLYMDRFGASFTVPA